jgi:MacB-like protein
MISGSSNFISCFYRFILYCAASFVPTAQRREWLREWTSELWYVSRTNHEEGNSHFRSHVEAALFCRGAFADAVELRLQHQPRILSLCNPVHCVIALFVLAVMSLGFAWYLPGAHTALSPLPYKDEQHLFVVSPYGYSENPAPTMQLHQYLDWKKQTRHLFTDIAFYQTVQKRVHVAPHRILELTIAEGSSNLLDLLHMPLLKGSLTDSAGSDRAKVVLGERIWRDWFRSDPNALGHTLRIAGKDVVIVAVMGKNAWKLPGHPDLWLLENDRQTAQLPGQSRGFLLAHMQPSLSHVRAGENLDGSWTMSVVSNNGDAFRYVCTSVAHRCHAPLLKFLFALLLAAMALPATTSLPLGDYGATSHGQSWNIRLRRWIFLATKLVLIVPTVYFVALDIAYAGGAVSEGTSTCLELVLSFCGCLTMFRWALRDQRRRCPVCLETLQNPARVGEPSRNFLAWNGTELICVGGHGFLHVPEISTSWFSTQRWLYLDPSWSSLFDRSGITPLYL